MFEICELCLEKALSHCRSLLQKDHTKFLQFDTQCLSDGDSVSDFLSNSLMLGRLLLRFISTSSARRQAGNGSGAYTNAADTLGKGRPY